MSQMYEEDYLEIISEQLIDEQIVFTVFLVKEKTEILSHNQSFGMYRKNVLSNLGFEKYLRLDRYVHPNLLEKMKVDYNKDIRLTRYFIHIYENDKNEVIIVIESFFNISFKIILKEKIEQLAYLTPAIKELFKKEDSFTIEKIDNYINCDACNSMNEVNKKYCETCGMPIEKDFMHELRTTNKNGEIVENYKWT